MIIILIPALLLVISIAIGSFNPLDGINIALFVWVALLYLLVRQP